MKIDENQKPRRDGLIEARGTWGEVTIGCLLALTSSRTEVWEVVEARSPDQWEYAHTPWFRVVERGSGELRPVRPRLIRAKVRFLLEEGQTTLPPRQPVNDAERAELLVAEALGATEIYTLDKATGEIWCPHDPHDGPDGTFIHLRIAHGMDTTTLEAITDVDQRIATMHDVHGKAHARRSPLGKGGFPHRHVPEDHSYL